MELKELLVGDESFSYLPEVLLRTGIMFTAVVAAIRILGKRGVRQLSLFEVVLIISMGSAAGDPMFYKDVGVLTAMVVFLTITLIYKLIMYLLNKSERFERVVEGMPVYLIREGKFCFKDFENEALAIDECFAELRQHSVSQLGQIRAAIMEPSGSISVFYYEDKDVLYGLPILPDAYDNCIDKPDKTAYYSCKYCGHTHYSEAASSLICPVCQRDKWVLSTNERRIK